MKKRKRSCAGLYAVLSTTICLFAVLGVLLLTPASPTVAIANPPDDSAEESAPNVSDAVPAYSDADSSLVSSPPISSAVPSAQADKLSAENRDEATNLVFTAEEIATLDKLLSEQDGRISVYFQALDSGAIYTYNAEEKYFIASLVKAPYSMWLYTLAESGKADLNERFTVTEEDKQEGTGTIKDMDDLPKEFTLRELISLAIRESDNTAMEVLLKQYPASDYQQYAADLGLSSPEDIRAVTNGKISANDAGIYLNAVFDYIEHGKFGQELKSDMLSTSYPIILSRYPASRKYGWGKEAYHDMAVVYAPRPYLLAICTDWDKVDKDGKTDQKAMNKARAFLGEFSRKIERMWDEKYQSIHP